MTFDPLAPGVTIANVMSDLLLDSQRSARMVAQRAIDPTLPGFADLLKQIKTRIFAVSGDKTYDFALQQLVQRS